MRNNDSDTQALLEPATDRAAAHVHSPKPHSPQAAPTKQPRHRVVRVVLVIAILGGGGYGARRYIHNLSHEDTDNAFVEGTVVQVSPRIAGHVVKVAVKDNQHVEAGDLLVEIDPRDFETRLAGAQSTVKAAEARLRSAEVDLATVRKTAVAALDQERGAEEAAKAAVETANVRLAVAKSMQAQAKSHIVAANAAVEQAKAETEAAEAEAGRAKSDLARYDSLFKSGGITAAQLDQYATLARATAAAHRAAERRVAATEAQAAEAQEALRTTEEAIRQAESQIKESQAKAEEAKGKLAGANIADERVAKVEAEKSRAAADLDQAKAALRQAELDFSYTRVCAPRAGTVTRKSVEEGNYIRPGQMLMGLVSDEKWIVANFKETQVEYMRAGQAVTLHVDAYPHLPLTGHIDSLQRGTGARFSLLPAENATGNYVKVVQRVPVKIVFDGPLPPDITLSLGMSVVPEVKVK